MKISSFQCYVMYNLILLTILALNGVISLRMLMRSASFKNRLSSIKHRVTTTRFRSRLYNSEKDYSLRQYIKFDEETNTILDAGYLYDDPVTSIDMEEDIEETILSLDDENTIQSILEYKKKSLENADSVHFTVENITLSDVIDGLSDLQLVNTPNGISDDTDKAKWKLHTTKLIGLERFLPPMEQRNTKQKNDAIYVTEADLMKSWKEATMRAMGPELNDYSIMNALLLVDDEIDQAFNNIKPKYRIDPRKLTSDELRMVKKIEENKPENEASDVENEEEYDIEDLTPDVEYITDIELRKLWDERSRFPFGMPSREYNEMDALLMLEDEDEDDFEYDLNAYDEEGILPEPEEEYYPAVDRANWDNEFEKLLERDFPGEKYARLRARFLDVYNEIEYRGERLDGWQGESNMLTPDIDTQSNLQSSMISIPRIYGRIPAKYEDPNGEELNTHVPAVLKMKFPHEEQDDFTIFIPPWERIQLPVGPLHLYTYPFLRRYLVKLLELFRKNQNFTHKNFIPSERRADCDNLFDFAPDKVQLSMRSLLNNPSLDLIFIEKNQTITSTKKKTKRKSKKGEVEELPEETILVQEAATERSLHQPLESGQLKVRKIKQMDIYDTSDYHSLSPEYQEKMIYYTSENYTDKNIYVVEDYAPMRSRYDAIKSLVGSQTEKKPTKMISTEEMIENAEKELRSRVENFDWSSYDFNTDTNNYNLDLDSLTSTALNTDVYGVEYGMPKNEREMMGKNEYTFGQESDDEDSDDEEEDEDDDDGEENDNMKNQFGREFFMSSKKPRHPIYDDDERDELFPEEDDEIEESWDSEQKQQQFLAEQNRNSRAVAQAIQQAGDRYSDQNFVRLPTKLRRNFSTKAFRRLPSRSYAWKTPVEWLEDEMYKDYVGYEEWSTYNLTKMDDLIWEDDIFYLQTARYVDAITDVYLNNYHAWDQVSDDRRSQERFLDELIESLYYNNQTNQMEYRENHQNDYYYNIILNDMRQTPRDLFRGASHRKEILAKFTYPTNDILNNLTSTPGYAAQQWKHHQEVTGESEYKVRFPALERIPLSYASDVSRGVNYTNELMEMKNKMSLLPYEDPPSVLYANESFGYNKDIQIPLPGIIRENYDWTPLRGIEYEIDESIREKLKPMLEFFNFLIELKSTKDNVVLFEYYGPIDTIIGHQAMAKAHALELIPDLKDVRLETERRTVYCRYPVKFSSTDSYFVN